MLWGNVKKIMLYMEIPDLNARYPTGTLCKVPDPHLRSLYRLGGGRLLNGL